MKIFKLLIFSLCLSGCVKKSIPKPTDVVTPTNVKGMVYNNCTDSGLAGVDVYFETFYEEKITSKVKTASGQNGEFTFLAASIHSDELYTYAVHIDSKSGTNAPDSSYAAFEGTTMYFSSSEAKTFLKPRVTPGFFLLRVVYEKRNPINTDTLYLNFAQLTFHKNVPFLPYVIPAGAFGDLSHQSIDFAGYPMGLYNISIRKITGGTTTITNDSIYIGVAGTQTYFVNW
jgi:hypothetical protein